MAIKLLEHDRKNISTATERLMKRIRHKGVENINDFVLSVNSSDNTKLTLGPGIVWIADSTGDGISAPNYWGVYSDEEIVLTPTQASGTRFDAIVAYYDKNASVASDGTAGANITIVEGTDGGSGVPTDAQIQAAIGSGNPYEVLWYFRAPTSSAPNLATDNLLDARDYISIVDAARKNYLINSDVIARRFAWYSNTWGNIYYESGKSFFSITGDTSSTISLINTRVYSKSDDPEIQPGDVLLLSGYIENTSGSGNSNKVSVAFKWYDSDAGAWVYYDTKYIALADNDDTDKRFFTYQIQIPDLNGHGEVVFYVYASGSPATYKLSNLKLEKGVYPTAYAPRPVKEVFVRTRELKNTTGVTAYTDYFVDISTIAGGNKRCFGLYSLGWAGDVNNIDTYVKAWNRSDGATSVYTTFWADAVGQSAGSYKFTSGWVLTDIGTTVKFGYKAGSGRIIIRYSMVKMFN